jgi:hypothetical protein
MNQIAACDGKMCRSMDERILYHQREMRPILKSMNKLGARHPDLQDKPVDGIERYFQHPPKVVEEVREEIADFVRNLTEEKCFTAENTIGNLGWGVTRSHIKETDHPSLYRALDRLSRIDEDGREMRKMVLTTVTKVQRNKELREMISLQRIVKHSFIESTPLTPGLYTTQQALRKI